MQSGRNGLWRSLAVALAVFAALILGGLALIRTIESRSGAAESGLVRDAVRSAILTCYAVEGAYPPDIDYLKRNYGLAFNEELYIVSYDSFASNVMPDVRVMERGADR